MGLFVRLTPKIALIGISSFWFLNIFLLIQIMLQFTTSQRGKRILIFEDEKFNEARFNEKTGLTTWRCSKRPCESEVFKYDDLFGKKKLIFYIQCCFMNVHV